MRDFLDNWLTVAVGAIGSIVGAIGAITTLGLIEGRGREAKETKTEEKSD